jgi:LPS sulfotransferase NodH
MSMNVSLLLSTPRSGSHFLKSLIETRFPAVTCTGEVLENPSNKVSPVLSAHPDLARFWSWYREEVSANRISAAPDQRMPAFEIYLTRLISLAEPNHLLVDVKYNSIHSLSGFEDTDHGSADFITFVRSHHIPVLHLIRKNVLKTLISHELARRSGTWHRSTEKNPSEILPKILLNPKKVLRNIKDSLRLTADYQEHFADYPKYEEVVYEDVVLEPNLPQPGDSLQVLALFLGKAPHESPSPISSKKTTPDDPAEVVENWSEIVRALHFTQHSWMTQPLLAAAA